MALTAVARNEPSDAYVAGLRGLIDAISPVLLQRDRWGFDTLREGFGIEATSALYVPDQFTGDRLKRLINRGREMTADFPGNDDFLGGIGYDFSALQEPYRTEIKAYFAWRLSRPEGRSYNWHGRAVRLIQFITDTQDSGDGTGNPLPRHLIDFGHPIEDGNGNASTPLRALMEAWLAARGLSTWRQTQAFRSRSSSAGAAITKKTYGGPASMPANGLLFTLVLLRERCRPLDRRNLILLEDVYPHDEVPEANRKEPYIHFYGFRLPWLRDAARRFVLSKIEHRELSASSTPGYIARLMLVEACLLEKKPSPQIHHITQEFIDHTFLTWGNDRSLTGKNWYADGMNMLQYASSHMGQSGWPHLSFDKRNLRRVHGDWPGGRGYQQKVEGRMVPEEVVEQIFLNFETLPVVCKRLLVIVRYTGMRSIDLHMLAFDCLKPDPDDPRFMLLTFYQSKVKRWNTKPLHVDDAAHALVIKAITEQRDDVRRDWGRETKYLFPSKSGDREVNLSSDYTRDLIAKWVIANGIRDKGGKIYEFGWHDFRHFYGTELALAGHDIVLIQMELGHASADMSMVYVNQRLKLKKKAALEKGGGKFITIKGEVDDKVAELAVRKDAALAVDVPGGLCSLPGQIGEWCEHNRACFSCSHFRADVEQLPFFEGERRSMTATLDRLAVEVAEHERHGRSRMADIGRKRMTRMEQGLANVATITATIRSEGIYSGGNRKYQRAACGGRGAECPEAAPGRGDHRRDAPER